MKNETKKILRFIFFLVVAFFAGILTDYTIQQKRTAFISGKYRQQIDEVTKRSDEITRQSENLEEHNRQLTITIEEFEKENSGNIIKLKNELDSASNISVSINRGIEEIRDSIREIRNQIEETNYNPP